MPPNPMAVGGNGAPPALPPPHRASARQQFGQGVSNVGKVAEGHERVYTAGQPEAETERHRRVTGIPVAPVLAQQCNDIAASLGVKPLT